MSDLSALTNPGARVTAPIHGLVEARIATTALTPTDTVMVLVGDARQQTGPCVISPRGELLPSRGDRAYVQQARDGQTIVMWWEPA